MTFEQREKIRRYIRLWKSRGYTGDIPDSVPTPLMRMQLAPSYQAIALAILGNDHALHSLGYSRPHSEWYDAIKRVELGIATSKRARARARHTPWQLELSL